MNTIERIDTLFAGSTKERVDRYFDVVFHGADAGGVNVEMCQKIVDALDSTRDGRLQTREVKVLFSRMLGIPVSQIPDDHEG